jgi:hypothetical protein
MLCLLKTADDGLQADRNGRDGAVLVDTRIDERREGRGCAEPLTSTPKATSCLGCQANQDKAGNCVHGTSTPQIKSQGTRLSTLMICKPVKNS